MASKIHPIEAELSKALELKRSSKETDKSFHKKMHTAACECDGDVWANLSLPAQGWVNEYTDFVKDTRADAPTFAEIDKMAKDGKFAEEKEAAPAAKDSGKKGAKEKAPAKAPAPKAPASKKGAAPKADKAPTKKAPGGKRGGGEEGYKGHRAGSRKETVHKLYDDKGGEAALKKALALDIKEGSAKSWIASWGGFKKGK